MTRKKKNSIFKFFPKNQNIYEHFAYSMDYRHNLLNKEEIYIGIQFKNFFIVVVYENILKVVFNNVHFLKLGCIYSDFNHYFN